jgi:hypothetical protein
MGENVANNYSRSESLNNGSDVDSVAELLVPQAIAMITSEREKIDSFLNFCNADTCIPVAMKDIPF